MAPAVAIEGKPNITPHQRGRNHSMIPSHQVPMDRVKAATDGVMLTTATEMDTGIGTKATKPKTAIRRSRSITSRTATVVTSMGNLGLQKNMAGKTVTEQSNTPKVSSIHRRAITGKTSTVADRTAVVVIPR